MARGEQRAGSLFGLLAALNFGVVVVALRSLARDQLPVASAVGGRYGIAAAILFVTLLLTRRSVLPAPGERLRPFLLGLVGYVIHSSLFYIALGHGTAGALAMIFYTYPSLIIVIELIARIRRPSSRSLVGPMLSTAGAALVVASGVAVQVELIGFGLAFAAAVSFSFYMLANRRLIRRSDPVATAAWVALGITTSMAAAGLSTSSVTFPTEALVPLAIAGAATAAATACVYAALLRLDAGAAAAFLPLQALVALALASVVLGEEITVAQVLGGTALVIGAGLASRRTEDVSIQKRPPGSPMTQGTGALDGPPGAAYVHERT